MSASHQRTANEVGKDQENSLLPRSLPDAISYFSSQSRCVRLLASRRWRDGQVHCPVCGRTDARFMKTRTLWQCKAKHQRAQFSVTVGTIFEDSHISLSLWLTAIWRLANSQERISSYDLARDLRITQKSAWFLLKRLTAALRLRGIELTSLSEIAKGQARSARS
jgi:hypothetical protein